MDKTTKISDNDKLISGLEDYYGWREGTLPSIMGLVWFMVIVIPWIVTDTLNLWKWSLAFALVIVGAGIGIPMGNRATMKKNAWVFTSPIYLKLVQKYGGMLEKLVVEYKDFNNSGITTKIYELKFSYIEDETVEDIFIYTLSQKLARLKAKVSKIARYEYNWQYRELANRSELEAFKEDYSNMFIAILKKGYMKTIQIYIDLLLSPRKYDLAKIDRQLKELAYDSKYIESIEGYSKLDEMETILQELNKVDDMEESIEDDMFPMIKEDVSDSLQEQSSK